MPDPQPHLDALRGTHAVRAMLHRADFRRLFGARLSAQWADGMFQASLAGSVLFNPQHAASPAELAASFAVLLLPYSFIGPFVGVLLDRHSRRHLMTFANLLRAVMGMTAALMVFAGYRGFFFFVVALLALSLSRFFLSGLSAALPHVVERPVLVSANAFTTTSGTVISLIGGGCAIGLLNLVDRGDQGYGAIAAGSIVGSLGAAYLMSRFQPAALGPDHAERASAGTVLGTLRAFVAGARHLLNHNEAIGVLIAIAMHRFVFGAVTVSIINQFKNHVTTAGIIPNDISGIGLALATGGAGALLAAATTPAITRAIGKNAWVVLAYLFAGSGGSMIFLIDHPWAILAGTAMLGFAGQAVKVCGDTIVQETVDESYRGRVFSVFDTSFNVAFVLGVLLAATALDDSGRSTAFFIAAAMVYLLVAIAYRLISAKHDPITTRSGAFD